MAVISDGSPLILYAKLGRLALLPQLFTEVLIPPAVRAEIMTSGPREREGATILAATWIRLQPTEDQALRARLLRTLDAGEAETIALAVEVGGALPLLMDDCKGRREARARGLSVRGSAGLLVLAKDHGLIATVRPLLDDLRTVGLYLSESAYQATLASAGER